MSLNLFSVGADYKQMLNKLAWWNFFVSLVCGYVLYTLFPVLQIHLDRFPTIPFHGVPLSSAVLLISTFIAFLGRSVKLHDRLSDLLGIRANFDVNHVLSPLAEAVGLKLSSSRIGRLRQERKKLMRNVFYRYVSSTEGQSKIDRHYIVMALDQWYWLWVSLQTSLLVGLSVIILLIGGRWLAALSGVIFVGILIIICRVLYSTAIECARTEIEEIVRSPDRVQEIIRHYYAL